MFQSNVHPVPHTLKRGLLKPCEHGRIGQQPSSSHHTCKSSNDSTSHKRSLHQSGSDVDHPTRTVHACEVTGGLHVLHVLDVAIGDDGDGNAALDGLNGIVVNGLVPLIRCTTVDRNPRYSRCLHLLTKVHCLPDIFMDSEDYTKTILLTNIILLSRPKKVFL